MSKAEKRKGLTHREASVLLACENKEKIGQMYDLARQIKKDFYGNRIVMFAPLYLSNYCVNGCVYCPYHMKNKHTARKKLTQEELAHISGYSVPHFKKLFRDETGTSPIRYLNDFRIGRAKDLLASGLFSVQEVATACGFENVYYFSNVFKKQTGISPKHYKKS